MDKIGYSRELHRLHHEMLRRDLLLRSYEVDMVNAVDHLEEISRIAPKDELGREIVGHVNNAMQHLLNTIKTRNSSNESVDVVCVDE